MSNSLEPLLPADGEQLTTGWEPGLPADDSIVRNYLLTVLDRLATMAELTNGRIEIGEGAALVDLASPYVFDNVALCLGPWSPAAHREIAEQAGTFFGLGRAYTVLTPAPAFDLALDGLRLLGHPPLMWRPAGGVGPVVPDELDIRRVRSPEELADFERTLVAAYPLPDGGTIADARLLDRALSAWVGYVDGRPVATAGSHTAHGLTEVEWVSTLPEWRGRGYGGALSWAATSVRPEVPAVLLASDDGQPVYRRLGYIGVLRLSMWLRPSRPGV